MNLLDSADVDVVANVNVHGPDTGLINLVKKAGGGIVHNGLDG